MDFLKKLFENGALTWEQFEAAVTANGYKVADLSTGNYVSKKKFDDEIATRDTTIGDLQDQISTRDTDIKNLQTQIADGSKDNDTKISELNQQITKLQNDYETARTDYENKLSHQAYEFAVKEFASGKKFTSKAAQRDFTNEMLAQNLQMKDNSILGADDFMKSYQEENPDAFVVEGEGTGDDGKKPTFVKPGEPGGGQPGSGNAFNFNFMGVRPHPAE